MLMACVNFIIIVKNNFQEQVIDDEQKEVPWSCYTALMETSRVCMEADAIVRSSFCCQVHGPGSAS
jgi:hypothetical protein